MDTDISIVAILDKLDLVIGDTAEISFRSIKNGLMVKISYRFFGEIKGKNLGGKTPRNDTD